VQNNEFPGKRERVISGRVWFRRPAAKELEKEGFHAADMHCHTNHSDAPVSVGDALEKARNRGIGLAITDHNEVSGSLKAIREAPDVLVIPGIEVSALDGPHILIYFYTPEDLSDFYQRHIRNRKQGSPFLAIRSTTSEILDQAEGFSCICAAAHPFGYLVFNKGVGRCVERAYLPSDILPRFDALEAICGGMSRSGNEKAMHLAERYGLGIVGGSDAHLLYDYGNVLTFSHADSVGEFLDAIKSHQTFLIGKEKNILEKGLMGTALIARYIPYTLPSLAIHYEQNIPRVKRFLRRARGFRK
jgi:predicted metal-dependent phosphoesterase TrpH